MSRGAVEVLSKRKKVDREIITTSTQMDSFIRRNEKHFIMKAKGFIESDAEERARYMELKTRQHKHDGSVYEMLDGEGALIANKTLEMGEIIGSLTGCILTEREYNDSYQEYDLMGDAGAV